jgi:protein-S-isoprenylcysteine O-methyltransferase Ste14
MSERWSAVARRMRVPLGFAFALVYLWLAHPTVWSIVAGVAIALPGLALRAVASGHVEKNQRLTTSGPYAYTRNPLYLGSLIMAMGFAVAARSLWIVAGMLLLFLMIYLPVIRGEEEYLRVAFPEFDPYAERVPRLLPRLTAPGSSPGEFSRALYLKHREYNASLGVLAVTAVLLFKLYWLSR